MSTKFRDLFITSFLAIFLGLVASAFMLLFLGKNPIDAYEFYFLP